MFTFLFDWVRFGNETLKLIGLYHESSGGYESKAQDPKCYYSLTCETKLSLPTRLYVVLLKLKAFTSMII